MSFVSLTHFCLTIVAMIQNELVKSRLKNEETEGELVRYKLL